MMKACFSATGTACLANAARSRDTLQGSALTGGEVPCVREVFKHAILMQQFQPKLDFATKKSPLYKNPSSLPHTVWTNRFIFIRARWNACLQPTVIFSKQQFINTLSWKLFHPVREKARPAEPSPDEEVSRERCSTHQRSAHPPVSRLCWCVRQINQRLEIIQGKCWYEVDQRKQGVPRLTWLFSLLLAETLPTEGN